MKKRLCMRPAIAMIELIFALLIMGLTLMSAPMIIRQAINDTTTVFQQEAVAETATQLNNLMTYAWDHWDVNVSTIGAPILITNSLAIANCMGAFPPGVTTASGRYCVDQQDGITHYNASPIQLDSNYQDVDDFDSNISSISIWNGQAWTPKKGDYIDLNVSLLTTVSYGNDTPKNDSGANGSYGKTTTFSTPFSFLTTNSKTVTSNIKLINVTLTSTNKAGELSGKNIVLGAFMCNIGMPKEIKSK